jgi:hypothetical protein
METQKSNPEPSSNMLELSEDEKTIIKEVKKKFNDSSEFRFDRVGSKFEKGNAYMVEFTTKELKKDYSWYYAYVDNNGCQLFADGDATITYMQTMLDKKRSFVQRLGDFNILDLVGAIIALSIIAAFVHIVWSSKGAEGAVSKEFLTIVSLILGYYFGRNKTN